jgi:hypothetical protein
MNWNLSSTITYADGTWEIAELLSDPKGGFRRVGPDISRLPEIRQLIADVGITPADGTYHRSDVTDVNYRFSATNTNGHISTAGGIENFYDSNNESEIASALLVDPNFKTNLARYYYRTFENTAYLYPVADMEYTQNLLGLPVGRLSYSFNTTEQLARYVDEAFIRTATTAAGDGGGYSMGVPTVLKDLGTTLDLYLTNGLRVCGYRLVEQITDQSTLAPGRNGNSPTGTVGFVVTYCDWNLDGAQDPISLMPDTLGFLYGDPLRVQIYDGPV